LLQSTLSQARKYLFEDCELIFLSLGSSDKYHSCSSPRPQRGRAGIGGPMKFVSVRIAGMLVSLLCAGGIALPSQAHAVSAQRAGQVALNSVRPASQTEMHRVRGSNGVLCSGVLAARSRCPPYRPSDMVGQRPHPQGRLECEGGRH
jgi:hypothetical protein